MRRRGPGEQHRAGHGPFVATVGPPASDPDAHRLGAVGRFVHRFKWWIGAAILAVAAIVLFTWNYPTTMVVVLDHGDRAGGLRGR
ncbi:hypothetical protein ACFXOD_27830 [Streptomyces sp. NPDC059161]|uniref:hypothetical protein n=1 Tax=Streptomyces sp. NPDC059161 TaxID=3346749 RepID=UPI0036ABA334